MKYFLILTLLVAALPLRAATHTNAAAKPAKSASENE